MKPQLAPILRYAATVAGSFAVIAGSVFLLLEAPTSAQAAKADTPTVAALKRTVEPKGLPMLTASDFDIARSVVVDVKGKSEARTLPAEAVTPATTIASIDAPGMSAVVTADAVNLRAAASKTSARLGVVYQDTAVAVLETERGWSRIQTEDGQTGWLATKFLRQ